MHRIQPVAIRLANINDFGHHPHSPKMYSQTSSHSTGIRLCHRRCSAYQPKCGIAPAHRIVNAVLTKPPTLMYGQQMSLFVRYECLLHACHTPMLTAVERVYANVILVRLPLMLMALIQPTTLRPESELQDIVNNIGSNIDYIDIDIGICYYNPCIFVVLKKWLKNDLTYTHASSSRRERRWYVWANILPVVLTWPLPFCWLNWINRNTSSSCDTPSCGSATNSCTKLNNNNI